MQIVRDNQQHQRAQQPMEQELDHSLFLLFPGEGAAYSCDSIVLENIERSWIVQAGQKGTTLLSEPESNLGDPMLQARRNQVTFPGNAFMRGRHLFSVANFVTPLLLAAAGLTQQPAVA